MLSGSRLCPAGFFHCTNGRCISAAKKCDKQRNNDCGDGSDEQFCSCNPHTEFQCATGERTCILAQFRCDLDKVNWPYVLLFARVLK